jgi:adenylyltransferase/sulfurtransferase
MSLSEEQYQRYARHLLLPEIGVAGQQRLLRSRAAVVGAGGLGSPALLYLAAAGVGYVRIIDPDVVTLSNLQRQVVHRVSELERRKVDSARETLAALNPDVEVDMRPELLTEENALDLLADVDAVMDGSDNIPTRYLLNDACFFLKKPWFYGAISRFAGQTTTFAPGREASPCYRCLFPDPPPTEAVRACHEVGVLGVLPGLIGMIQATECIKWLLGLGRSLIGRLVLYDALPMRFRELPLRRDPQCALCGNAPTIKHLSASEWPVRGEMDRPPRQQ